MLNLRDGEGWETIPSERSGQKGGTSNYLAHGAEFECRNSPDARSSSSITCGTTNRMTAYLQLLRSTRWLRFCFLELQAVPVQHFQVCYRHSAAESFFLPAASLFSMRADRTDGRRRRRVRGIKSCVCVACFTGVQITRRYPYHRRAR